MSLNKRINFVMSNSYNNKTNNGYLYSVQKGIESDFFGQVSSLGKDLSRKEKIEFLKEELSSADAILIGAGAGLSTSAGITYTGEGVT